MCKRDRFGESEVVGSPALHLEGATVEPACGEVGVADQEIERARIAPLGPFLSIGIGVELKKQPESVWIVRVPHLVDFVLHPMRPPEQLALTNSVPRRLGYAVIAQLIQQIRICPAVVSQPLEREEGPAEGIRKIDQWSEGERAERQHLQHLDERGCGSESIEIGPVKDGEPIFPVEVTSMPCN